jgi:hypothetical protein
MLSRCHLGIAAAFALGTANAQIANAPCYETNFGSNLHIGLDQVHQNVPLGFTFPGPAGPVTSIDVGSNGFVWLASNISPECCDGDETAFLDYLPRIAACWLGLDMWQGNGVWFNAIAGTGGAPSRAVITWDSPEQGSIGTNVFAQLQLLSDGSIVILHGANNVISGHTALVGISSGNFATPDLVDFSTLAAMGVYDTGTNPTVYDVMPVGTYDLTGKSFEFLPNGNGGYLCLERLLCSQGRFTAYGRGCPQPPSFYEWFPLGSNPVDVANTSIQFQPNGQGGWVALQGSGQFYGNFSNNLGIYQDQIARGISLPFTWPSPAGPTNVIDVDISGCIYPVSGVMQISRNAATPAVFLSNPASLAVFWEELWAGTLLSGAFFDVDPNGQAAYVTWSGVNEAGASGSFTFQLALFPNGGFEYRYGSVANHLHDVLIGFTTGNYAADPGSRDLDALPWNTGGVGPALTLSAPSTSHPQVGSTFTMDVANVPASTAIAFMVLAFHRANIDLASLGGTGCTAFVDFLTPGQSAVAAFAPTGATSQLNLPIPNNNGLLGFTVYLQAAMPGSASNALGIIFSNGGEMVIGH